ncbi:MAG: Z1 domain-containing protein [Erysipelotrichaceae bacterium]
MNSSLIHVADNSIQTEWKIKVDGFYKSQVEEKLLEDEIPQESIDKIFENAVKILSKCPNPKFNKDISQTGILIGKVQSGKTSNFISLVSLAFDNEYDIAIILGGNTLQLLQQNAKRVSNAFNVNAEKLTVLKTDDNKMLINSERIKEFIENRRKIIIVGLKHYKHINLISEIFNNQYLSEKSILIIDDEGDQATLNTKAFINSMSSTYESVVRLKSKLKSHCFISITATPQANILIKVLDSLSPDFGELVYPGDGYCGLQEFHGENRDKYIVEIPSDERNLIDDEGVPLSLYKALSMFFVGNAIRRNRNDYGNHAMLIHPSQKKYDHKQVVNKIQNILDTWKALAKLKLTSSEDIAYNSLKAILVEGYSSLNLTCQNLPNFNAIEFEILNIIKQCSPVHICNSDQNASENS